MDLITCPRSSLISFSIIKFLAIPPNIWSQFLSLNHFLSHEYVVLDNKHIEHINHFANQTISVLTLLIMAHPSRLTFFFSISILTLAFFSHSLPLSTNKRWIIDESTGHRVKLRCVSWVGHLHVMLAEGLDKQPMRDIVSQVVHLGFNCVRLTWATFMFTRYANRTVVETLDELRLQEAKDGIAMNNPFVLNMTHLEAYDVIVNELSAHGLMVVSDNHMSEPKWCCDENDGNGFFGDKNFDAQEWLQGLSLAAKFLKNKSQVVALSLRNALRGPLQNVNGWYGNITEAAQTVHKANPNVLVIISGLNYDTDFTFLKSHPLILTSMNNKTVYEVHSYKFGSGEKQSCDDTLQDLYNKSGFLIINSSSSNNYKQQYFPLFMSEVSIDLSDTKFEEKWMTCVVSYLAKHDLDWGWWTLQGSYYLRQGRINTGEAYGLLNFNWNQPTHPQFHERFKLLLTMIQDPGSTLSNSYIIFHPQSGQCLKTRDDDEKNQIEMSDCGSHSQWIKEEAKIKLLGTSKCLKADGEGLPVTLSNDCFSLQSSWIDHRSSRYGLLLATTMEDGNGQSLCLQKDDNSSTILTKKCICEDEWCLDNSQVQWFQLVSTNVGKLN